MMFLNEQQRSLPVIDQSIFQACFPGFNQNELQVDENDIVEKYTRPGSESDHDYQVLKFSDHNQETIQIITPDKGLCKFIVQDKEYNEEQIREEYDDEEDFDWQRDESKVIFATEDELYLLTSEKVNLGTATEKVLECEECSYQTFRKSNLLRHSKTAHALKRHECPTCGTNFADSCSLKRHMRTAHENILYSCELCDFKSTRASSIKEHTNVVTSVTPAPMPRALAPQRSSQAHRKEQTWHHIFQCSSDDAKLSTVRQLNALSAFLTASRTSLHFQKFIISSIQQ